ncbi:MAG TPA: helix-turn-helix transcriptional regulator [Vicinamibacterales bacterium]|nr:helix-turn-helix transcriptional regulator [Vicinamibacterales bacterium]
MSVGVFRLDDLKAARQVANLTEDQLARRAVLRCNYLRRVEGGCACTPAEAQRLADALGTNLAGLGAVSLVRTP